MDDLLGELVGFVFEVVLEIVWAILSPLFEGLWWLLRLLFRGILWLFGRRTRDMAALQRPECAPSRSSSSGPGVLKQGMPQDLLLELPRSLRLNSNRRCSDQRPSPRQRRRFLRQFPPDAPTGD